jgi:Protein of unknown function (DUF3592)
MGRFEMWHPVNPPTVFGLLLLVGAVLAWRNAWLAYASLRWPTAPARLDYLGLSGPGKSGGYGLTVRYSYTVNGMTYESTRWRFGSRPSGNMPAITLAASTEIKPIDPVVFYDPDKPGRSCLVAGLEETTLTIPIVCSVMGVVLIIVGIR